MSKYASIYVDIKSRNVIKTRWQMGFGWRNEREGENHMIDFEIQYSDWNAKKILCHGVEYCLGKCCSTVVGVCNIEMKIYTHFEDDDECAYVANERENGTKQIASADSKWKL